MTHQSPLEIGTHDEALREGIMTAIAVLETVVLVPTRPKGTGTVIVSGALWRLNAWPCPEYSGYYLLYCWEVAKQYETMWLVSTATATLLTLTVTHTGNSTRPLTGTEHVDIYRRHRIYINSMWPLIARELTL